MWCEFCGRAVVWLLTLYVDKRADKDGTRASEREIGEPALGDIPVVIRGLNSRRGFDN